MPYRCYRPTRVAITASGRAMIVMSLAILGSTHAASAQTCPPQGTTSAFCSLTAYPDALCNDGSAGVYHIRLSKTGNTAWLFYLEGGGECNDVTSCNTRRMTMKNNTSASPWVANSAGILSTSTSSNPDFATANVVEVHYCSSDYWSGGKTRTAAFKPGNADTGWDFQGRAIATAALTNVMANSGIFSAATRILFTGSSAGGIGIALTYNDLSPMLPVNLPRSMAVDAGYTLEIDGFDAKAQPNYMLGYSKGDQLLTLGQALWQGHGDASCVSQMGNVLACYLSGMLINSGFYKNIPVFVAEAEADTAQLHDEGWTHNSPLTTAQETYLNEFATAMRNELEAVPTAYGVYAPSVLAHELFLTDAEFGGAQEFPAPYNQTTPQQALSAWYNAVAPIPRLFGDMPLP